MQLNITITKPPNIVQLKRELREASIPVEAVYLMDRDTLRVAAADWASETVIQAVVAAHVPGTYAAPVAQNVTEVANQLLTHTHSLIDGGLL